MLPKILPLGDGKQLWLWRARRHLSVWNVSSCTSNKQSLLGYWSEVYPKALNWDLSNVVVQDPASADNTAGTQHTHTFVLFQSSLSVAQM